MIIMKNIKYLIVIALVISGVGCSDEFLERTDYYSSTDESYFSNEQEVAEALTGAYSVLPTDWGANYPMLVASILSDECLGGGDGSGDAWIRSADRFEPSGLDDRYINLWASYYAGIFRVNSIIARQENAVYADETKRNRDIGEAYFLRAYFYFYLAEYFGSVPLLTEPVAANLPRADVDVLFSQIASDMKMAIELLPSTPYSSSDNARLGHATKWAAESFMARIYLFYTGTYSKSDLPLNDGGAVTKNDVVGYLEDVINNSGHALLSDFPNLWPYTADGLNENVVLMEDDPANPGKDIPGATVPANLFKEEGRDGATPYSWVGDEGANIEAIFTIQFNNMGNFGVDLYRSNQMALYIGLRSAGGSTAPYGTGWGFAPVHSDLWDSFEDGDIRKHGSIINVHDEESQRVEGSVCYTFNRNKAKNDGYHVTGLINKKHMPVAQQTEDPKVFENYWTVMGYSTSDATQHINLQNIIVMRYADVLLMHSELTGTADGLNQVRRRAGLDDISYSLDALKAERRHELAFEGVRYFDLMRWGDLAKTFAESNTIKISNGVVPDGTYPEDYTAPPFQEDRKFIQIPESQVRLSGGVLTQQPGWE